MLNEVIGQALPLTLAIAISPLSIVTIILMLLSENARRSSFGFLLGWLVGIAVPVAVFVLLAGAAPAPSDADGPDVVRAIVQFVLATLLVVLAGVQWHRRPKNGAEPTLPGWMSAIDSLTFGRALGLGALLSAARPKNLLVAASAGVTIGGVGLSSAGEVIAIVVFVVCAASTVLVPVVAFAVAAERLRAPLESLREWLVRENTVITVVLLVAIGVLMFGKGLGSL